MGKKRGPFRAKDRKKGSPNDDNVPGMKGKKVEKAVQVPEHSIGLEGEGGGEVGRRFSGGLTGTLGTSL